MASEKKQGNPAQKTDLQPLKGPSERFEALGRFFLGAQLFLLPLFFWLGTHDQFELPKLFLMRLLSLGALASWLCAQAFAPVWRWRKSPLDWPLLAWSLWLVIKTIFSVSPPVSFRGEYENFAGSLTQLNYSLLYWLTLQLLREGGQARRLLLAFEASALMVAGYALCQALKLDFIGWASSSIVEGRYFASMGNPNFLGALMVMALSLVLARAYAGWDKPSRLQLWGAWAFLLGALLFWLLLYALFSEQQLSFSAWRAAAQRGALRTGLAFVFGLGLALTLMFLNKERLAAWLLWALEALLLFKALADTGTRGALMGLLAVVALFLALGFLRLNRSLKEKGLDLSRRLGAASLSVILLLGALLASSLFLGPQLRQRMARTLLHPAAAFDESRMQIWVPALKIAAAFPLTGCGVDTFKTVFPQFQDSKFNSYDGENVSSRMAHCEPLQILATMGVLGLGSWIWLLAAWFLAWRRAQAQAPPGFQALQLGVLALAIGYLVQNLVSFGVSAISMPFFSILALPFSLAGGPEIRKRAPGFSKALLSVTAVLALAFGSWAAWQTLAADQLYNFGNLVTAQLPALERDLSTARGSAAYALDGLRKNPDSLSPQAKVEMQASYEKLAQLEQTPRPTPQEEARLRPFYAQAAQSLLLILSAQRQEEGVRRCPYEVKYHVYLGLAYEELFKRSVLQGPKEQWFLSAEKAYTRGTELNPRNAYYHGNLGRIYSLRAGEPGYLEKAESEYKQALALAPVTRLFYENMLLLYAEQGLEQRAAELIGPVEKKDPRFAARLYGAAGTLFAQSADMHKADLKKAGAYNALARDMLGRAMRLEPQNPDYPYVLAAMAYGAGKKAEARAFLDQALTLNARHEPSLKLMNLLR